MKRPESILPDGQSTFMTDEFLSILSHELRTPLTPILGWVSLLRQNGAANPQIFEQALDAIERNAEQQKNLVNDLLDTSLLLSGQLQLDKHLRSLNALVRGVVQSLEPQAAARDLRFEIAFDETMPPVEVDGLRIHQAIANVLNNALKFSPPGSVVTVRTCYAPPQPKLRLLSPENEKAQSVDNGWATVEICDHGEGIAPELLPHIFDMFRQGDSSFTRRHGGLGLGLSIAKSLIELHGGTIRAESEGEGLGARFVISLPPAPMQS